nr:rRNA N6-adenosine-methyltransferase ZCCHC4-like [Procambarus clarkii]
MAGTGRLGVDLVIDDTHTNPSCVHGPTVLFERFQGNGQSRRFYACSACRDRRGCTFFHWADQKITSNKQALWAHLIVESTPARSHEEVYKSLEAIKKLPVTDRSYCTSCSTLLRKKEISDHGSCVLISPITNKHLSHPSTVSDTCPHLNMSSLMMDIDDRYCSFFPPEQFIRYNMFNHHFFDGEKAKDTYQRFISGDENLVLVTDPPFGGRMELLAHNLKKIQEDWRRARGLDSHLELPVLFIFPYFMEPQVVSNLPSLTMLDYQVDYDNHPLYSSGPKGMRNGSAVRVFVNRPQSMFPLPEEAYRFCKVCDRWVSINNLHCDKCNGCMSKDGRTYRHCDECMKCVKPSWIHCSKCLKCQPQDHKCQTHNALELTCHMCGHSGHKRMDCPKRKVCHTSIDREAKKRKKKNNYPQSLEDERERNLEIFSQLAT